MIKVDIIIGVRPDIILASALNQALSGYEEKIETRIIHTGQHSDAELSHIYLEQLQLKPTVYLPLEVVGGNRLLGEVIIAYEEQITMDSPDLVIVIGNSSSALACALVAARKQIKLAHIDAGNRYHRRGYIEEQNDLLIDQLSTYLFTSNAENEINLIREGFESQNIIEVGSLRSDAVFNNLGHAEDSNVLDSYGLEPGKYVLAGFHHGYTLQNTEFLISFLTYLETLAEHIPVHLVLPSKVAMLLEDLPEVILESTDRLQIVSTHSYHDMLKIIKNASLVISDSQGLQEESTILGVQCLTLGNTTNRPVTLAKGTNTVVGYEIEGIQKHIDSILSGDIKDAFPIDTWDGKVGQRIAEYISKLI